MTGYCEVLKALSAMASITSCHVPQNRQALVFYLTFLKMTWKNKHSCCFHYAGPKWLKKIKLKVGEKKPKQCFDVKSYGLVRSITLYNDLKEDLSGHGEAMCNDGLFIWRFPLPAVQLQTAAASQKTLTVHLWRGNSRELTSYTETDQKIIKMKYLQGCI